MKALLDTHTFLWWITDDPRLLVKRECSGWEYVESYHAIPMLAERLSRCIDREFALPLAKAYNRYPMERSLEQCRRNSPTWLWLDKAGSPRERYTRDEAARLIQYAEQIIKFCKDLLSHAEPS
jgi:HEPN domain-containing protein